MASNSSTFSRNLTHLLPKSTLTNLRIPPKPSVSLISSKKSRLSLLSPPATSSSLSVPINVDYLDREFGSHGVSFEDLGDICVVKMRLDNGTFASIVLPYGLVTSYKPKMWHGGTVEVLHTDVSEGLNNRNIAIRGGISMDFNFANGDGLLWTPSTWILRDVRGSSDKFIQVELVSISPKDMVEVRFSVTLQEEFLGSEINVTNSGSSSFELTGSIISHLTVSTPEATYAVGLQGSDYSSKLPITNAFSIIPPNFYENMKSSNSGESWAQQAFLGFFFKEEKEEKKITDESAEEMNIWREEDSDYAEMKEKMSRVYIHAPREFTVIDRGRRNSVVIRRSGFEELYIFSPGSDHEWYGKHAFVCLGPSATIKPIKSTPGSVWKGSLYLQNPNL